jgi:hypothetical protein
MTTCKQNKLLMFIALVFIIGAVFLSGTAAYAAEIEPAPDVPLNVKEVWLTGDTLHISVSEDGGEAQTLELNLSDYAKPGDEYVTIQATDDSGRASNAITFKNPYYQPDAEPPADNGGENESPEDKPAESEPADGESEPSLPDGANPFTPDGNGTVIDDATDAEGKEFFTVETPDGNTFYLIVDRQRDSENVYLLNAVTENDLASLAKEGDGLPPAETEPVPPTPTPAPTEPTPEPTPEPEKGGDNTAMLAFVGVAALVAGGAVYYFKFVRPKKNADSASDFGAEDYEDEEMDVENDDGEDGEDE